MKMIRFLTTAAAALALVGTNAMSQGMPNVKKACAADREKLCPGIADVHAARKCMRSHMADVSPDCHTAIEAAKSARAARKTATEAASAGAPAAGPPPAAPH